MLKFTVEMPETQSNINLNIEGMTCTNCALSVSRKLEKNPDIDRVTVNFTTGEASFHLKNEKALPKAIADIEALGYHVLSTQEAEQPPPRFSKTEGKFMLSLAFTIPLFFSHMFFAHDFFLNKPLIQLLLCLPVMFIGLQHFGKSAWSSLLSGFPNMDVLVTLGSGSAFVYSLAGTFLYEGHQVHAYLYYETAATIITLILLGNVFEQRSVKRTSSAIGELTKLQAVKARKVEMKDGKENIVEIPFGDIQLYDILVVNTGDKIPTDGIITQGAALLDESMITGESLPVTKKTEQEVVGGTLVTDGQLRMAATRVGKNTVLSQIIQLVKSAQEGKPEIQQLGDKVSAIFVPVVVGISVITFFIRHYGFSVSIQEALMNSVAVLVISCPCAMGLATPTAVMVGIGRAARKGILIKGGRTLELFAGIKNCVFDKTGTLSTGDFQIGHIELFNGAIREEIFALLYQLESHSSHPIAKSIVRELQDKVTLPPLYFTSVEEEKGMGLKATDKDCNFYIAGSREMVKAFVKEEGFQVYLLKNNQLIAALNMNDQLKPDAAESIAFMRKQGIEPVLLSGDTDEKCREVGEQTGIKTVYSQQKPAQKLEVIHRLMQSGYTAMVGDGINDAPSLAKATVGISISNASQAAIQQAQIVLLSNKNLNQLTEAWLISKHTLITIKQNLFWAFFYNVVAIPLAAAGMLNPMIAALSMAFSDVVVVGNSIRLRTKKLS
jgi:Cu+-exporting ATPase